MARERKSDKQVSVLLVDDHSIFVDTLTVGLTAAGFDVVASATNAEDAENGARRTNPDVALLDVEMPGTDGLALARRLRTCSPGTKVVMLTGSRDPNAFAQAMEAGASGYLLKESSLAAVAAAIRRAAANEVVVPEQTVTALLDAKAPSRGQGHDLTRRELQVLALLASGSDVKAVAKTLGITWHTARSYVKNVLVKLGARSQLEAVAKATRLGIIGPRRT